ncbi:MAG: hypothetical protein OQK78_10390 [Gammaproteobacteria bacterium]|nr:hypothetical protein [Gammaproteobacteria bacterium]
MDRKNFIGVLVVAIIVMAIALSIPGREHDARTDLPWLITPTETGLIEVFGLTIGHSTLKQVENKFQEPAEVSLFERGDDRVRVVEAYFDRILLSAIKAQVVVVIDASIEDMERFYKGGTRIAKMGNGGRKVSLNSADLELLYQMPIHSMTYIPKAKLNAELLTQRFGVPQQKVVEEKAKVTHWLYPDKGLDIVLNESGKAVFQYLPPKDFSEITVPLQALAKDQAGVEQ